ncbi:MAG: tetratricopeptide repeat protein [Anaerolineales bacterium]|jgi:ATP/maltotriose-dependent transcriptional regulator MalT/two-component SAPR family response regulator
MSRVGIPTSRTKVIIPALRPEVLRRARLLALFDDLLEKKLILITAPAGYGKTSLLVNFAHQSEMPVCWLSLDALDKDPQRFITYLIAALAERFPYFGKRSNAVLRTMTNFEQDSERLLSSLVNETKDLIKEHFALIVDDYHFVDIIPPIRDIFSRFISLVGENCHVILASRNLPTLPDITLMVARQQVGGFDLEELAFRPDEIRGLFEQNYGVKLADDTTEELVRQTEGWITGLLLSASEATRGMPEPSTTGTWATQMRAARLTGVDLAVYFDQQVLSQQPPELRQFLLQTSLLEEFDLSLCEAVLGAEDWKNLFETVKRNNLFVLPVGPQGKWLRYHHLFMEFLQERIFQELPEIATAILTRLAHVYEERREWEKAFALTRQLNNPDALAGLVERVGTLVLSSEHLITLQSWLDEFSEAVLEKRPALLSLKGTLLAALGDGRTALSMLDRAIALLQNENALPGLPLTLVRRAAARRLVGDYSGAIQDADEVLKLAKNSPGLKMEIAEARRFKGICLFRLGQVEDAVLNLEDSLHEYELLGEVESIARVQMDMGWVCQATGKYAASAHFYQKALAEWKREDDLYSQSNVLNNLAVLDYMQGDYETAIKTLEEGLVCARQGGFRWQEAMLLASLGDVLSDLDEYESAHQTYTTATSLSQQVSYQFLVNYLLLAQARLARLRSRLKEAHSFLQEVRPLIQSSGSNYELGLLSLESGCLSLTEGRLQPALSELQNALGQFQTGNLTAETDWTRVWLAAALAGSGEEAAARDYLRAVLGTLSQEAGDPPLIHILRHAAPWLAGLHADPEIDPLLRRVTQAGQNLPILRKRLRRLLGTAPLQTSRLTIQLLGKPQVRMNGKLVALSQWQTISVRDLFFFFLYSSHPVTKDEVGLVFWPDIDSNQLKLRFKNNLYRLRHALGQDVIIFENNLYFFNRALDYEYDVEEFDAHLAQVRVVEQIEDKIVHLRFATRLWHGPYLQGVDADWAWPERHRLEQAYLDALRQLAGLQRQIGDRESALQTCQRALEVNSCLEDFHRLAMQLHADRGDRLAVIWQYQACRNALQAEWGILPSEETQALYQRLIA